MKALFKRYVFQIQSHIFFYIASAVFPVVIALLSVSSGVLLTFGESSLNRFFSFFPICISFLVPIMVSFSEIKGSEHFPLSDNLIPVPRILACSSLGLIPIFLTVLLPAAMNMFAPVDLTHLALGYFGIILFELCAVSFAIFIFTAIQNHALAFLTSMVFLLFTNFIHFIPAAYAVPDFMAFVFRFLSFQWHFNSFSKGILSSKDLLYNFSAFLLFYMLAVRTTERKRGKTSRESNKNFLRKIFTLALVFAVSERLNLCIDISSNKDFTPSAFTKELARKVEEPLQITYYYSPELKNQFPNLYDICQWLETFSNLSPKIKFRQTNASDKQAQEKLSSLGISGKRIPLKTSSGEKQYIAYSEIVIEYLGETEAINFIYSLDNLEFLLTQKLEALMLGRKNTVQFVSANTLGKQNYSCLLNYLSAMGFNVIETCLPSEKEEGTGIISFDQLPKIPLLIAGCENMTKQDCNALEAFFLNGGKGIIASQDFDTLIGKEKFSDTHRDFKRMLFTFGIYLEESILHDRECFVLNFDGKPYPYYAWPKIPSQESCPNGMYMAWPVPFTIDNEVADMEGLIAKPIILSSESSWQESDKEKILSPVEMDFGTKQTTGSPSFLAAEIGRKVSDVFNPCFAFISDQDFITDSFLAVSRSAGSEDMRPINFIMTELLRVSGDSELCEIGRRKLDKNSQAKFRNMDSESVLAKTRFAMSMMFIVPAIINLTLGLYFSIRRRRFNSK